MCISKSLYIAKGSTNYLTQDPSVECCISVMVVTHALSILPHTVVQHIFKTFSADQYFHLQNLCKDCILKKMLTKVV
jgi:hypothetical protein